jgi:hypothetical protein
MSAAVGKLRVVETPCPRPAPHEIAPETSLRRLFKREAALERELLEVRRAVGIERARYALKHNLICFPSIDTLRRLFS